MPEANRYMKPIEKGRVFDPSYDSENAEFEIQTGEWTLLANCYFGEARLAGLGSGTKWTADYYVYDIFERMTFGDRREVAMRWQNGSGCGWFITKDLSRRFQVSLLDMIVAMPDENLRWDACHFLWESTYKGALAASKATDRAMRKAFAEGRMKKKKLRGRSAYQVTVN